MSRTVLYNGAALIFAGVLLVGGWKIVDEGGSHTRELRTIPIRSEPVGLGAAPRLGRTSAPFVLIVFSDFQCPFCRQFALHTLPPFVRTYVDTDQVQIVFRHLPLPIHFLAEPAARLAECSRFRADGLFWKVHDELFRTAPLRRQTIQDAATLAGLEADMGGRCFKDPVISARLREDMDAAALMGVTSTPTLFLGRLRRDGNVDLVFGVVGAVDTSLLSEELNRLR